MKHNTIVVILLIIIIGAGGFFAGMKYQQSKSQAGRLGNFQNGRNGQVQSRREQGFRPVNGEIIAVDDKSVTVKLQDGSSKIIILTDTTAVNKSAEGSREDLKNGSVTAQNVQLNSTFRGMPGGGAPRN